MEMITMLKEELLNEAKTTRKMLAIVPKDQFEWQPHERSMALKRLATHIAELPTWVSMTLTTSELDFEQDPYSVPDLQSNEELMTYFEQSLAEGNSCLATAKEHELDLKWTLRNGKQVIDVSTKAEVIRMTYCQIVHHRAQLGVYLRLLNIPIPGSYGPSADDNAF
jgi:uncharacterized damage-inducible protein DinB